MTPTDGGKKVRVKRSNNILQMCKLYIMLALNPVLVNQIDILKENKEKEM